MIKTIGENVQSVAAQRVIGFTRSVSYQKGKRKFVQESVNVGVQAWEIGAIIAAAGIYDLANGPGGFASWVDNFIGYNPSTGQVNPGSLLSVSAPSNPAQQASFSILDYLASGLQSGINHL